MLPTAAPPDNPERADWRPEIWSIGHRNVQGAALTPAAGGVWTIEHGARGGDEINIPQSGKNYGWPIITYGRDYSYAKIGEGTEKPGLEQPRLLLGPLDRAFGGGVLHRRPVSRMEGQPVRRRPGRAGLAPAGPGRRQDRRGGSPAERPARAHPGRAPGARRRHLASDRRPPGPRAPRRARSLGWPASCKVSPSKCRCTVLAQGAPNRNSASFRGGRRGERAPAIRLGPFLLTLSNRSNSLRAIQTAREREPLPCTWSSLGEDREAGWSTSASA